MRGVPEISDCKLRFHLQMKSGAIAIPESRRSVRLNLERKIQLGRAPQRLPQDLGLEAQLLFVADVLVLTAAALAEVRAWWRSAQVRWQQNSRQLRPCKSGTLFHHFCFDLLSW